MIRATSEGNQFDETNPVTESEILFIEALIESSCFDIRQRAEFARQIQDLTRQNVQEFITHLFNNQLDPVTQRGNHSATEVNRKLKKICKP